MLSLRKTNGGAPKELGVQSQSNLVEKYAQPTQQPVKNQSSSSVMLALSRSPQAQTKPRRAKTWEEKELARTRRIKNQKLPGPLEQAQMAFQKSLQPALELKCALREHLIRHVLWRAKAAAQTEVKQKKEQRLEVKKKVHFKS